MSTYITMDARLMPNEEEALASSLEDLELHILDWRMTSESCSEVAIGYNRLADRSRAHAAELLREGLNLVAEGHPLGEYRLQMAQVASVVCADYEKEQERVDAEISRYNYLISLGRKEIEDRDRILAQDLQDLDRLVATRRFEQDEQFARALHEQQQLEQEQEREREQEPQATPLAFRFARPRGC